jgi:hypothetical protein
MINVDPFISGSFLDRFYLPYGRIHPWDSDRNTVLYLHMTSVCYSGICVNRTLHPEHQLDVRQMVEQSQKIGQSV